jgi:protein-S-isoprenylcysteine O-methyltransferase Ste14
MSFAGELALLGVLWLAYFATHSLLASRAVKSGIAVRWPKLGKRYRLLYNLIAVVLLIPPAAVLHFSPGPMIWQWTGASAWLANGLALLAVIGFAGARTGYDLALFLGVRGSSGGALASEGLRVSGIHRYVRHPWYFFALIIIWSRDMSAAMLVTAVMITLYFVVGSQLEEAKLIDEFGEAYRRYRQRVPGLFPWPGRVLDAAAARRLEAGDLS